MRSSRAAISCSAASSRRSCVASRKRWCSSIRPSSARTDPPAYGAIALWQGPPSPRPRPALDQSLQHGAPGNPEDVAGDAGQLDVGRLQELQEPVALGRLALHELAAIAQQLAQLALRRRRNEALGDQPMADQIGDPLGILHIGLATRHVTDMPGVADDEVEMPFQHGIDLAPVNAGALHADLRHPKLLQPVAQRFQVPGHRPEGPDLLPRPLARRPDQDAGDDRLLKARPAHNTAQ